MGRFERYFTTSVSRILVVVAIASCGDKLDGPAKCDVTSCGSDQLCRDQAFGAADDGGIATMCVSVPSDCDASDCSGSGCPSCIHTLCDPTYNVDVTVSGRRLSCLF